MPKYKAGQNSLMHNIPCPIGIQAIECFLLLRPHTAALLLLDWYRQNAGLQAHYNAPPN